MSIRKTILIKWMTACLWLVIGIGMIVLLVAAIRKKDVQQCKGVQVEIKDINNNFFVDEKDVLNTILRITKRNPENEQVGIFNLRAIETELEKDIWINSAELYFDNNAILRVLVTERQPVARIYSTSGETFYLDSSLARLPLSTKFSARIPVFTGFPSDKVILSSKDSILLKDIYKITDAIQKDSFRMAMIEQIDITNDRMFEMVPKIGNQIIVFGDATDIEEKFNKLNLFYKEIIPKAGLSKYSIINLQYKSQIVAKRKGAEDVVANYARALQLMQMIAVNTAKLAIDSVQIMVQDSERNTADSSIIQQSIQREEDLSQTESNQIFTRRDTTININPVVINPSVIRAPVLTQKVSKESKKTTEKTSTKSPAKPKEAKAKVPEKKVVKPNPKPKTTQNDY